MPNEFTLKEYLEAIVQESSRPHLVNSTISIDVIKGMASKALLVENGIASDVRNAMNWTHLPGCECGENLRNGCRDKFLASAYQRMGNFEIIP